jgi:molybdopterin molybdotransferase
MPDCRSSSWKIAIKPGKPFAFGTIGATPLLGLPGNPVSAFVTFLVLARPFLLRRQGRRADRPAFQLPAAFEHPRPDPERVEYLRVQQRNAAAHSYPHQGSGVLSSCAWADGLVRVEPGQAIRRGDLVPYLPLSELLG